MKKLLLLIPIALLAINFAFAFANTTYKVNARTCVQVDDRITNINKQLRGGYKVQQGERLKENLRTLKKQRSDCKKKKYPTSD